MITYIHFIGTADAIRFDLLDNERFKTDYESFLATGKQNNQPYRLSGKGGNIYISFTAIAYVMTDIPPQVG